MAWAAGARPPKDFIVLDFDATLVTSHSEKEKAKATYKLGFGFHPLLCFVDSTNDAVAGVLRPGNAGSNTAADHIAVLDAALSQLPVRTKKADPENGEWMLARADSAGCTHGFLGALRERGLEFSVGFAMDAASNRPGDVQCVAKAHSPWARPGSPEAGTARPTALIGLSVRRFDCPLTERVLAAVPTPADGHRERP